MITVRIFFKDGTEDIREVLDIKDICLDNVEHFRIIRKEKAA